MLDWGEFFSAIMPNDTHSVYCIDVGRTSPGQPAFVQFGQLAATANARASAPNNSYNEWFSVAELRAVPQEDGGNKRQAQYALRNKCFVLDIDVRNEANTYTTKREAAVALLRLIAGGKIPEPSYVIDTGGGFHVYWALAEAIPSEEYAARAAVFAARLRELDAKLSKDYSLTKNRVVLLRMPGSHNQKYDPPVRVGPADFAGSRLWSGRLYQPDDIAPLADATAGSVANNTIPFTPIPPAIPAHFGPARAFTTGVDPLEQAADLFTSCAVMRHIRDAMSVPPSSPDYIGYGPWRSAVALLSRADNAQEAVHEMSASGYTYSYANAQRQLDAELRNNTQGPIPTGPITCAQLCESCPSHIGRSLCHGCPMFDPTRGTPYVAAKRAEAQRQRVAAVRQQAQTPSVLSPTVSPTVPPTATLPTAMAQTAPEQTPACPPMGSPDRLRPVQDDDETVSKFKRLVAGMQSHALIPIENTGITLDAGLLGGQEFITASKDTGVMYSMLPSPEDKDTKIQTEVSNTMIWPLRYVRMPDGDRKFLQIAIARVEDGAWVGRVATLDYRHVGGRVDVFAMEMMGLGVVLSYNLTARKALHGWFLRRVGSLRDVDSMSKFDHFGWNEEASGPVFVVGDYKFTKNGGEVAQLSDDLIAMKGQVFRLRGSVAGAKAAMNYIADHGSDQFKYAMMLSAGTPMMPWANVSGVYINLWGNTNMGKSLIASSIGAMWGNGAKNGATIATKDTANSRYEKLSMLCNIPATHDEATMLHKQANEPGSELGEYLYSISEAKGKARLTAKARLRKALDWSLAVFATSNACVRQSFTVGDETASAQVARAYEIEIDQPSIVGATAGEQEQRMGDLGNAFNSCSGVAGLVLGEYYARNRDKLISSMDTIRDGLRARITELNAEQRVRGAALSIAMMGAFVLANTGLWNISFAEAAAIIERMDAKVSAKNIRTVFDPDDAVSNVFHTTASSTAVVRHDSKATAAARTHNATIASNAGVVYEPKQDITSRVDFREGESFAAVTIRYDTLKEVLRRRNIEIDFFLQRVRGAGRQVTEGVVALHSGLSALTRDNRTVQAVVPPVRCVTFTYAVDPRTTKIGCIPSLLRLT